MKTPRQREELLKQATALEQGAAASEELGRKLAAATQTGATSIVTPEGPVMNTPAVRKAALDSASASRKLADDLRWQAMNG
jgi:hypothetical protein